MVLNRVSYPPCSLSQPWLKLYSYHDSQWLETNKNMNETSAKSFNNWCQIFWKFIFELEDFSYSIRMGLSLAKQLMSPQKMFAINKVHFFDFMVFSLHTFNPLSLSLNGWFLNFLKYLLKLGTDAVSYWLHQRRESIPQQFTNDFIIESLKFALKNNNVLFDDHMYLQLPGTAMGTKCAPPYACLTAGYLEETKLFT